jgi:hypothetical protein
MAGPELSSRVVIGRRNQVNLTAAALIAVQSAWWASIGLPGYFRSDDFVFIDAAHRNGLWSCLGHIYWEHFAPGHRLAFWLVGDASRTSWDVLQLALVAAFALGLVCLWWTLVLLFGRSWWLLVPLAVTGFAWPFALGFAWPSAGLHIIPEFAFGSLCIYAFLRHLESGRSRWLALSGLAFVLGLAFYIRVLLVPVLLVLIRYLFLEEDLRPRALGRAFWADRGRWVVFLIPALAYVAYFWNRHAFESPPPDSASQVGEFVRIAWLKNVLPASSACARGRTRRSCRGTRTTPKR